MNKKTVTVTALVGLFAYSTIFAYQPYSDIEDLDINCIEYIEDEPEINLGFDATDYLPEDFDPYKFYVDLNAIPYMEEENIELGFYAADYLPVGFDAYADPTGIEGITFIVTEDPIDLGFDTADYLPACFDPYEVYFNLNSIEYLEDEDIDLGFSVDDYLPKGFDPYGNVTVPLIK